ncbi:MAG: radical SAM protein [Planctomycetota bacterium]
MSADHYTGAGGCPSCSRPYPGSRASSGSALYAYPHGPARMTRELRENPKVLPYLDIPIQHIADPMLRAMKRGTRSDQVRRILDRLRDEVPGIAVRSTLIVGFPGETEEDFGALLDLVRDYRFERLGVFPYSREEGTPAFELGDAVPEEVVAARVDEVMGLTRRIIEERNAALVGAELEVLVDGVLDAAEAGLEGAWSAARTWADAPDIDCGVHLAGSHASGSFVRARIDAVSGYDLRATALEAVARPTPAGILPADLRAPYLSVQ